MFFLGAPAGGMDGYCSSPHWIKLSTLAECSKTVFDKQAQAAKNSVALTSPRSPGKISVANTGPRHLPAATSTAILAADLAANRPVADTPLSIVPLNQPIKSI
jgi:hypothetical protein